RLNLLTQHREMDEAGTPLTVSGSFREGRALRRRTTMKPSMDADEFMNLLHGSDPVKVELNRLDNEVRDKDRELAEANAEIKALRLSERLREKAVEEVSQIAVAVVVANEWKDANDKVMPVRQWLEDRRFMQGEMQQLRDKLSIAERTARSEAQLKEKYQLRLKVLEEGLRTPSTSNNRSITEGRSVSTGRSRRQSLGGADSFVKSASNGFLAKRMPSSQSRPSISSGSSTLLKHGKNPSKSFDGGPRSFDRGRVLFNGTVPNSSLNTSSEGTGDGEASKANLDEKLSEVPAVGQKDSVSGLLYDMLQKEMLAKKVETLTKAMDVEAKKMRREVAAMEKEVASIRVEKDHENRAKRLGSSKRPTSSSHLLPVRSTSRSGSVTRSTR
ncbi:hypothetical protein IFM89_020826, partial [Coptis chinensis]